MAQAGFVPDETAPGPPLREPHRVLVVEDDWKLAELIARALGRLRLEPVIAGSGDSALAAVRSSARPSALILDIMIPHPDGIEVCRQLRRDGWSGPIVAVSALDSPDTRTRVRQAGADAFLAKPFRLSELVETVRTLLDHPGATEASTP
ncbi:MAG: response regulator transcription factor [Actinomycetota bacterium]